MTPACHTCNRTLAEGESAWAEDWKVLKVSGTSATWRTETRYICDACAVALNSEGI